MIDLKISRERFSFVFKLNGIINSLIHWKSLYKLLKISISRLYPRSKLLFYD